MVPQSTLPFTIFVRGLARPKGSKRVFLNPSTGRPILVDDNRATLRIWQSAMHGYIGQEWTGPTIDAVPLGVTYEFIFPLPASAPKRNPPKWKHTQPDTDKLARAVSDVLQGVVFRNDAQIASLVVLKRYGEVEGVHIRVSAIEAP